MPLGSPGGSHEHVRMAKPCGDIVEASELMHGSGERCGMEPALIQEFSAASATSQGRFGRALGADGVCATGAGATATPVVP